MLSATKLACSVISWFSRVSTADPTLRQWPKLQRLPERRSWKRSECFNWKSVLWRSYVQTLKSQMNSPDIDMTQNWPEYQHYPLVPVLTYVTLKLISWWTKTQLVTWPSCEAAVTMETIRTRQNEPHCCQRIWERSHADFSESWNNNRLSEHYINVW